MRTRLPMALVGAGSMGLSHARVLSASPRAALSVVIDSDAERARSCAELHEVPWAVDLNGLGSVQAVVVAASTEQHADVAAQVIRAGLPVLVEKPMCPSARETNALLDLARHQGVPIMCGLVERFNPAVMAAMTSVEAPRFVRTERHSPYAPRIGTGVGWDLLMHDLDTALRLFGSRTPVCFSGEVGRFHPASRRGAEDVVEASLRFDDGEMVSLSASRIGQRKLRTMVIQELGRMIEVDLLRRSVTAYRHTTIEGETAHGGFRQYTEIEVPEIVGTEPLVAQLDHFVRLVDGDIDPDIERESVRPAHDIVDAILTGAAVRDTELRST
jgi:predicted dehydrogenase